MNKILLLLDNKENRRLLAEFLDGRYEVIIPDGKNPFDTYFDLGIVDGLFLDRHYQQVHAVKKRDGGRFLPFLLVTSRQDIGMATRALWKTVDELIISPVEKIELLARVHSLLQARQLSLEFNRTMIQASPTALILIDRQNNVSQWNPAAERLLGWSESEVLGQPPPFVAAEQNDGFSQCLERAFHGEEAAGIETRYRTKKDAAVNVSISAAPLRDEEGQIRHAVITLTDITERKRAEQAVAEQRALLRATLYSIGDAVISTDEQGRVAMMNPVAEKLTGWTEAEAAGKPLDEVFHIVNEESRQAVENPVARVLREGVVIGLANHTLLIARDGTEYPIADAGAPIYDSQGNITGVVLVFRDQTAERAAQRAVQEARQYAESIVATVRESLVVLDADLRVVSANRAFYRSLQATPEQTEGQLLYELGNRQWDIPELRQLLEDILPHNTAFDDYEVTHDFPRLGRRTMLLNARRIYHEGAKTQLILLAMEDVTERVRAEQAVLEQRALLRATLYSIGDAVISTDKQGCVAMMNPVAEKLTGWTEAEVAGKPLDEVFHIVNEESRQAVESPVARVLGEGVVIGLANHTLLIARDGTEYPIADAGAPIYDSQGNITGVVLVFRDQTAERKLQQNIANALTFSESIIATMHEPLLVLNADLRVIMANRAYYHDFQVSPEEVKNRLIYELSDGQWNIARLRKLLESILPQNTSFDNFEVSKNFKNLGRRTMLLNARRIYSEGNKTKMILLAMDDTTLRKQMEEELRLRVKEVTSFYSLAQRVSASLSPPKVVKEAIRTIIDFVAPDLVMVFQKEGEDLRLKGVGPQDSSFRHDKTPLHKVGKCLCGLAVKMQKPVFSVDIHKDARCTWNECKKAGMRSFAALPLQHGTTLIGVLAIASGKRRDFKQEAIYLETLAKETAIGLQNAMLHEQVQRQAADLEQRVQERTEELQNANANLESFAYSVSHDLRAPLRAITGFAEIIDRRHKASLNEEGQHYFNNISAASKHMDALIDDILKYSRLQRSQIRKKNVPLQLVVQRILDNLNEKIVDTSATISIPRRLPVVLGDASLLHQIFSNLLENAIKYRHQGVPPKIVIKYRRRGQFMTISVADNGIGIDSDHHDIIFDVFQRLHPQAKFPGTGIGLALAKKATELLDGKIWVESGEGQGSTFFVRLERGIDERKHGTKTE